ncbi:hypothetical protein ACGFI9_16935 [Micromonospora sp. NPDC048930]|uniref:hypothetical protein n=1 Tax=Micromonospora sp. NPDC048930 TaxID=3364261 RepID=UPI00371FB1FF
MWDIASALAAILSALAAVVAAWAAVIASRAASRAATRNVLDQRAPEVTVVVKPVVPDVRQRTDPAGDFGWSLASIEGGPFLKPWCLTKPGAQPPPTPQHSTTRPDDGDLRWAVLLDIEVVNHSSRHVIVSSEELVINTTGTVGEAKIAVLPLPAELVGEVVLSPGEKGIFRLPVEHTVREWAELYAASGHLHVGAITADDGQDYGVRDRWDLQAQLRPIEPADADPHARWAQHCQGCGDRLWVMRAKDLGTVRVLPSRRTYYYSKVASDRVPDDGAGWSTRSRRLKVGAAPR